MTRGHDLVELNTQQNAREGKDVVGSRDWLLYIVPTTKHILNNGGLVT